MSWGKANHDDDEALNSPISRITLCPQTDQIINCAMGLKHPIDVDIVKKAFSDSIMIKHPRFCSLMVRDHHDKEFWRKTRVNIDDHFVIVHPTSATSCHVGDDEDASLNAYMADLAVSTPLSKNKPLWEVHVLLGPNCIVLRVHHSICDGVSLMSMLSACFGKQRDCVEGSENGEVVKKDEGKRKWWKRVVWNWGFLKSIWLTLVFMVEDLVRAFYIKERRSVIYGGEGVELWPRKLETLKFELQEFKSIKKVIPNATVNDVLLGIISGGLSKYLHNKSPDVLQQGLQVTAATHVNLRKSRGVPELSDLMRANSWCWGSCSWGNKVGIILQPIQCCNDLHPLEHVKRMKAIMDEKKQSYEADLAYILLQLLVSCFGPKVVSGWSYKSGCNTSLSITNIIGPSKEIIIAYNPVTYIRLNCSSQPQALLIYMVSYAGKVDVQVMVAKDIIHDSQFLIKCFQETFLEMKTCIDVSNK